MNNKKILIINGHPDKESFSYGLSDSYKKGAKKSGSEIKEINIRELDFNPNLQYGYRKRTELEPDLIDAQEKLNPFYVLELRDESRKYDKINGFGRFGIAPLWWI